MMSLQEGKVPRQVPECVSLWMVFEYLTLEESLLEFEYGGHRSHLKSEDSNDLFFHFLNSFGVILSMADTVDYGLEEERDNVLILGGDEHTDHAKQVKLVKLKLVWALIYKSIKVLH